MTIVLRNERGIALVITLLVVSLLAIIVVEFTYSVEIDNHMGRNALNGLQAAMLARSGINLGEAYLLHDSDPSTDAFTEEWCPTPDPDGYSCLIDETNSQVVVPENMRLRVKIIDEGGKLNINLTRPRDRNQWLQWVNSQSGDPNTRPQPLRSWRTALEHLLEERGGDPQAVSELSDYWDRVFDAAFPGQNPQGGVARSQGTPTRSSPAGNPTPDPRFQAWDFPSLDDVSIIPSLSPAAIRRLRRVLTALPYNQLLRVNANTAPPEVLRAIIEDDGVVENVISQRHTAPLRQTDLIPLLSGLNAPGTGPRNPAAQMLGVVSSFFLIRASAIVNPNPVTGRGGISRSASMLVRRDRRAVPPNAPTSSPHWTLTRLDWQKEGGAGLFQEQTDQDTGIEGLPDSGRPGVGG